MAEELDIRSIWNKGKAQEDPSSIQINMLEKKGTKTTLYWVRFILWIEFALNLIFLVPVTYFMSHQDEPTWLIGTYIAVTILYLFYYWFLIRQINRFNYDGNVVQSLKKVYGYLRFYVLHYKVVLWLSLIIGVIMGYYEASNADAMARIDTPYEWFKFILIISIGIGVVGGILHLLVHLIYGRKIKRLRSMVKDLEKEE